MPTSCRREEGRRWGLSGRRWVGGWWLGGLGLRLRLRLRLRLGVRAHLQARALHGRAREEAVRVVDAEVQRLARKVVPGLGLG